MLAILGGLRKRAALVDVAALLRGSTAAGGGTSGGRA